MIVSPGLETGVVDSSQEQSYYNDKIYYPVCAEINFTLIVNCKRLTAALGRYFLITFVELSVDRGL